MSLSELGKSLVEVRRRLDAGEAEWLSWLVKFDRAAEWAVDGHLSCVAWLVDHCGMSRSTAHEKLRIAHQVSQRPTIAEAFARGELSYSKIRAITRITNVDQETDEVLVQAAQSLTATDMDKVARHFELIEEQERPSDAMARWERRGLHSKLGIIEVSLPDEQRERVMQCIDALVGKSPAGDGATWAQRRADALCDLVEAGIEHLEQDGAVDTEMATINVVCDYDVMFERAT